MIDALAHEYWENALELHPTNATQMGDRRWDHAIPDVSAEGMARETEIFSGLLARLNQVDLQSIPKKDRITAEILRNEIEGVLGQIQAGLWEWTVDPLGGIQIELMNLALLQKLQNASQAEAMLKRWDRMGEMVDASTANLRRALGHGKVATHDATLRVVRQLETLLQTPTEEWTLLHPSKQELPFLDAETKANFDRRLRNAVEGSIRPAVQRYLEVIRDEVLPQARPQDRVGLCHTEGGEEAYRRMIRHHTSLPATAKEIHEFGLQELEKIRAEMRQLGERVLGTSDLPQILERLRTDPALRFSSRAEIRDYAEESLRRAEDAMPRWFGRMPAAKCEVWAIEPYEEKDSTIAYYRQPAIDGSRPGVYYVNTWAPETRPRYEAQALAFHESVPGHHLQIAIAQELTDIPEFRKFAGVTAYVEGWALYTERLSEEMGLYSGDLDRIGMLSFDAWRACRLVVDTGIHAFHWTRQQAIDLMLENTALGANNIENEVDRYITWPGQALAYKIGQREMFRLRHRAEEKLGSRFDIRAFHDRILENGAISLPLLSTLIDEWIAQPVG